MLLLRLFLRAALLTPAAVFSTIYVVPRMKQQHQESLLEEGVSHARQLGLALKDFEAAYGRYPDATTALEVKEDTGTSLTLGNRSSNQLFRQMLVTQRSHETSYYVCVSSSSRAPDDLYSDDAHALAPGECGFTYVAGLNSHADPSTPVAVAPLIAGTTRFDRKALGGRAIVLRVDGSVQTVAVNGAGKALGDNGLDLFDPRQPYWRGRAPDLKWQE